MSKVIGAVGPSKYSQGGTVTAAFYHDGSTALVVDGPNGREYKATVCLAPEGPTPKEGFVWLKGWSDGEGVPEALEEAGIVKRTGEKYPTGFVEAELAEILVNIEE